MTSFFVLILVVFFLWAVKSRPPKDQNTESWFSYKLTFSSGFIITILSLVLIALGERILYDVARIFVGEETYDYLDNLQTIVAHSLVTIPLFAISIFLNVFIGEKRQKYAIVLLPYLVTTIILAIQLATQVSFYFYNHHTQIQFYLVMTTLTLVTTAAIYFIQKRWQPR